MFVLGQFTQPKMDNVSGPRLMLPEHRKLFYHEQENLGFVSVRCLVEYVPGLMMI